MGTDGVPSVGLEAATGPIVPSPSLVTDTGAAAMKAVIQMVLAIVAVVALIAGITFISQYQVGSNTAPTQAPGQDGRAKAPEVRLSFPKTIWEWDSPADAQFE